MSSNEQAKMETISSAQNFNFGFPTPGHQTPTGSDIMEHIFFLSPDQWETTRRQEEFDYVVIGSGFCALGFVSQVLQHNPSSRILILERGPFFLPEHFQSLPLPFQQTIGGTSETFPWTLSAKTLNNPNQSLWQHGMVPFFGGRSTAWSGWCPRPTPQEMREWPEEVIQAAYKHFDAAEKLMNVIPSNEIGSCRSAVYGILQRKLHTALHDGLHKIDTATRVMYAPMAVRDPNPIGLDFDKFSTVGPLLGLVTSQRALASRGQGQLLKIATNCVVQRIIQQENVATALDTSRGVVNLGNAKLILAMGSLPPTTLIHNSFPKLPNVGARFTSHFISSIIARIPRADLPFACDLAKEQLELGAIYLAGEDPKSKAQYHIQLTALSDPDPEKNAATAGRLMPDVVATASPEQLASSQGYVVLVCAVLGELDDSPASWMRRDKFNSDPTTNSLLHVQLTDKDMALWAVMDDGAFQAVEKVIAPRGAESVEYWHNSEPRGWHAGRPSTKDIRVAGMVHEGSTLHIGGDSDKQAVVGLDYRLKQVKNVYVTGGGLWPTSGSWNPTLTMVALAQDLADKLEAESHKSR